MGVVIRVVFLAVVAWLVWRGLRAVLTDARRANMPSAPTPPADARRPESLPMQACPRCGTFLTEDQAPSPTHACPACGARPPAA